VTEPLLTNPERVRRALSASEHPLDDDELSAATGISPRNQVNQICNRLARDGRIVREPGVNGKLVNRLVEVAEQVSQALTAIPAAPPVSAGSSLEQRAAEVVMLKVLSKQLGVTLSPRRLRYAGARVEVDGADADATVLVECWAHQGPAKGGQKYKLVTDAAKLHWIADSLSPRPNRLIIAVSDPAAISHLEGKSWQTQAIKHLGVEFFVVTLPHNVVESIKEAQRRQFR
jgi:hypothetical protein